MVDIFNCIKLSDGNIRFIAFSPSKPYSVHTYKVAIVLGCRTLLVALSPAYLDDPLLSASPFKK